MQIILTEKKPIKLWLEKIEDGALLQAKNLANLPFIYKHVAIMPDSHQGYGMPIGGVIACENVVIPNAVGVDIGCGMCAVETSLEIEDINKELLIKILERIKKEIPVGFSHHNENQEWEGFNNVPDIKIIQQEIDSAKKQIGTLGGGNHFIEIQKSVASKLWIMLHSGSRNFGLKIAKEYHDKALSLCSKWHSDIPDKELSFLPMDTIEAKEYFSCMNFALSFAKQSRLNMIEKIKNIFIETFDTIKFNDIINIHHNYAAHEHHFNKNVIVHRKGATLARLGTIGIIPGSQGSCSYIITGKGNIESFMSCSHGAGRKMGRKEAIKKLNLEEEISILNKQGIIHNISKAQDLEEATSAYKNIDEVMINQNDLVDIKEKLFPIAVIKA